MSSIEKNPKQLFEEAFCSEMSKKGDNLIQEYRQSCLVEMDPVKSVDNLLAMPGQIAEKLHKTGVHNYKKCLEEYNRQLSTLPEECLVDSFPDVRFFGHNLFNIYKNMVESWEETQNGHFCVVVNSKALPGVSQVKHIQITKGVRGQHAINPARVKNVERQFEFSSNVYIARRVGTRKIEINQSQDEILSKLTCSWCLNLEETLGLARIRPDLFTDIGMLVLGSKYCDGQQILRVQNHEERIGDTNEIQKKIIVGSVNRGDHLEKFHFATAEFFTDEVSENLGKKK